MKILGVTGSRAEFGILRLVFLALQVDPRFDFQLAVTGQHWAPGSTSVAEIEAAGLTVDYKVDMGLSDMGKVASALCAATGRAVAGAGEVYDACQPDMVLVLGDRYEILAFAFASLLSRIPVVHLSGGDVTEGAFDDSIRHALTKLSAVHFAFTQDAVGRICQMGEDPANVHFTGNPAIDSISHTDVLDRAAFLDVVGVTDSGPLCLITLHPETLTSDAANRAMTQAMLDALDQLPDARLIFTGSNADPGADQIDAMVQAYVAQHNRAVFFPSLGSKRYFSALTHCDVVLGNSSSGLAEAPSFGIPTVNIGDRQKRRPRAVSVIDCAPDTDSISQAITHALTRHWDGVDNPFGKGNAVDLILHHLAQIKDPSRLIRKSFRDLTP